MSTTQHFTTDLFAFFRDLQANNDRDWFKANKARYEKHVKEPMLRFIVDFGPNLARISPHFKADPRPVGGSMFRIYRDTRFSKDKSPYKTHGGIQFRHEVGKDVHAPGFYLHLAPDSVFAGSGMWHPDSTSLAKVRQAIDEHQDRWTAMVGDKEFKSACQMGGEKLKRAPKGYPADHPLVEDLKRKDFVVSCELDEGQVCRPGFMDDLYEVYRQQAPLVAFLAGALGLAF